MKITVFGCGYVGLVTSVGLADVGNDVICMDVDSEKIDRLKKGQIPIYEAGLENLVKKNIDEKRLYFTSNVKKAVNHGMFLFIAVGTPPDEDGSADIQYVLDVASDIARYMQTYKIIVNKSTVPVGTADKVRIEVEILQKQLEKEIDFDVVSNPEFLKEGAAINDFMKPDRIIIGASSTHVAQRLKEVYAPFNRNHERIINMDVRSAEFTKYAANAMLATRISAMNEMANLAERLDVDIEQVRQGIGADKRIGFSYIYSGCGYGGSCLPKDVNALVHTAKDVNCNVQLLQSVEVVNRNQKMILFEKINKHFGAGINEKIFALWGLSFKPNTDDMREAPSRVLMESIWDAGGNVRVFDPAAMDECHRIYGDRDDLIYCETPDEALTNADALIIVTEWRVFNSPDFEKIKQLLKSPLIFDGRNLYDPQYLKKNGFIYYAIGRGVVDSCE